MRAIRAISGPIMRSWSTMRRISFESWLIGLTPVLARP